MRNIRNATRRSTFLAPSCTCQPRRLVLYLRRTRHLMPRHSCSIAPLHGLLAFIDSFSFRALLLYCNDVLVRHDLPPTLGFSGVWLRYPRCRDEGSSCEVEACADRPSPRRTRRVIAMHEMAPRKHVNRLDCLSQMGTAVLAMLRTSYSRTGFSSPKFGDFVHIGVCRAIF